MKIVIDIPDEDYKFIKELQFYRSGRRSGKTIERNVINAIKNGNPYEERPTAKWIVSGFDYKCSNCGMLPYFRQYNFCPNCGADMRGKENE